MDGIKIREASADDAPAICSIYNYYIENTPVSFETDPLTPEQMQARITEITEAGFPYYVAEIGGWVVGYCYLHRWKERRAYARTLEVTVYLDKEVTGRGIGSLLLRRLLAAAEQGGTHVLIAGICIPNEASVRLHEKFGFRQVSHMKQVGRKFDRWHDVGHWELILGEKL